MKKSLGKKCFCGHFKKDHTKFVNKAKNKKGSRYVCVKDNCNLWNLCDIKLGNSQGYSIRVFFSK